MTAIAVYAAVNAVSLALSKEGLSKSRQATGFASYKFRGIDEVMNALAPLLVAHKLIIVPRILERECVERHSNKGNVLFSVTVAAEFDFISAEDGSKFTARTYGEAMDSGDKATNKAMAIAYKYAAFQTFCIPTEGSGDTDPDATVHEPTVAKPKEPTPQASKPAETPIKVNAPSKAAGGVTPASPRKTVEDIPDVAPAQAGKSYRTADDLLAKLRITKASLRKDGSNLDDVLATHAKWETEARNNWDSLAGIDRRRVKAEQAAVDTLLATAAKARGNRPSHIVKPAAPKAAISQGDEIDRETGGVLSEAAE